MMMHLLRLTLLRCAGSGVPSPFLVSFCSAKCPKLGIFWVFVDTSGYFSNLYHLEQENP